MLNLALTEEVILAQLSSRPSPPVSPPIDLSTPAHPQSQSTFFRLPAELRREIYRAAGFVDALIHADLLYTARSPGSSEDIQTKLGWVLRTQTCLFPAQQRNGEGGRCRCIAFSSATGWRVSDDVQRAPCGIAGWLGTCRRAYAETREEWLRMTTWSVVAKGLNVFLPLVVSVAREWEKVEVRCYGKWRGELFGGFAGGGTRGGQRSLVKDLIGRKGGWEGVREVRCVMLGEGGYYDLQVEMVRERGTAEWLNLGSRMEAHREWVLLKAGLGVVADAKVRAEIVASPGWFEFLKMGLQEENRAMGAEVAGTKKIATDAAELWLNDDGSIVVVKGRGHA
ncbi:hypothetical protein BDZ85DRAFT_254315 [Elsinoe ampelina]|uniref:DUF7730 domain-containing protein n=1 Tax=Elsinoe ampelina TaxID=302913 RepID=A0A6A6GNV3_9PEZI|nr:hypothetical protein BDZ85DRAFT_254315 [Elsinoe ampelina]